MSLKCPDCDQGRLNIRLRIELPGDAMSDEISLWYVVCDSCAMRGLVQYEESRRGALDSDSWHSYGHRLAPADLDRAVVLISRCPQPQRAQCRCASHAALGKTDANGHWDGLRQNGMRPTGWFDLIDVD
ncbi:MAG: hypothetical protein JXR83_15600 [Deltaproteobacteria bacterium]|nr:hypothetical protein [Deltaproteobacteria bacterium]